MGSDQEKRLTGAAESGTFGADIAGFAIDQAFGEIWTRPGLDRKARSLVTLAEMVALKQPNEFAIHIRVAMSMLNLSPNTFHGEWNYTVSPNRPEPER